MLLLLFLLFLLFPVWVSFAITGREGNATEVGFHSWLILPTLWAAGIGLVLLGLGGLLRKRPRLVLFLRRFGNREATRAVTVAAGEVGRSWRLVTLDDAQIAPVGVGAAAQAFMSAADGLAAVRAKAVAVGRVTGKIVALVGKAAVLGAAGAAAFIAVTAGGNVTHRFYTVVSLLDFRQLPHLTHLTHLAGGMPAELFWICAFVAAGCLALLIGLGLLCIAYGVAGFTVLLGPRLMCSAVDAAEAAKNRVITDVTGIVVARRLAHATSRHVFSPRLAVMTVDSEVWQLAVGGLAAVSAVPLIDVSRPSENLFWEIEQMRRRFGARCVFVGDYDQVKELSRPAAAGTMRARQQELLDGCQVLAYTDDEQGLQAFTRALRATFELAVRLPRPAPRPPDPITRKMTRQAARQASRDYRDKLARDFRRR